jgi:hypothetical protein
MHRASSARHLVIGPANWQATGSLGACLPLASPGLANWRRNGGADAVLRDMLKAQEMA